MTPLYFYQTVTRETIVAKVKGSWGVKKVVQYTPLSCWYWILVSASLSNFITCCFIQLTALTCYSYGLPGPSFNSRWQFTANHTSVGLQFVLVLLHSWFQLTRCGDVCTILIALTELNLVTISRHTITSWVASRKLGRREKELNTSYLK